MDTYDTIDTIMYMFSGLGWFIGAFTIAVLWTAYLTVVADIKFVFRFIAIPAWLVFTIGLLVVIDGFMGHAYPGVPPKSQVISYRVIDIRNPEEATIEAWMYLTDDSKTRLYLFPYTVEREEALKQALKGRRQGQRVEVDLNPNGKKENGVYIKPTVEDMIKYDIRHRGLPPKLTDGQPQQEQGLQKIDNSDKYMMMLPNGSAIEVKRGSTVTVGQDGEIEISTPKFKTEKPQNIRHRHDYDIP